MKKIVENKGEKKMSLADEMFRHVPEYYPTMYLDGFTPEEIMWAADKAAYKRMEEKGLFDRINIRTEIKIK